MQLELNSTLDFILFWFIWIIVLLTRGFLGEWWIQSHWLVGCFYFFSGYLKKSSVIQSTLIRTTTLIRNLTNKWYKKRTTTVKNKYAFRRLGGKSRHTIWKQIWSWNALINHDKNFKFFASSVRIRKFDTIEIKVDSTHINIYLFSSLRNFNVD